MELCSGSVYDLCRVEKCSFHTFRIQMILSDHVRHLVTNELNIRLCSVYSSPHLLLFNIDHIEIIRAVFYLQFITDIKRITMNITLNSCGMSFSETGFTIMDLTCAAAIYHFLKTFVWVKSLVTCTPFGSFHRHSSKFMAV